MPTDPHSLWLELRGSVLVAVPLTVLAYLAGCRLQRLVRGVALANPVLIAIMLVMAALVTTGTPYSEYFAGARVIHLLLGPATVALAIPLAANIDHVRRNMAAVLIATAAGAVVSAVGGAALVRLLGGDTAVAVSMMPKSATTPIAMGVSQVSGGIPALTASFAVLGGIVTACLVQPVLRRMRVTDWRAYGLAAGTAGSGLAAARVYPQHPTAGAFAGLAIGLNGLITAIVVPLLMWAWHL